MNQDNAKLIAKQDQSTTLIMNIWSSMTDEDQNALMDLMSIRETEELREGFNAVPDHLLEFIWECFIAGARQSALDSYDTQYDP